MSTDDPNPSDLPPAVRETLDSLGGALGDIAELDKEQLNETIGLLETLGHDQAAGILRSRREVLKGAGAATGLGIAGLAGATATGGARAQSDTQSGTIGNGNQDADLQDVSAESVSTESVRITDDAAITVDIPSDYPTLQAAVNDLSKRKVPEGVRINLNIESGHQPDSGIIAAHGDYSRFRVTADGGSFSVGDNWTGPIIKAHNAIAPTLAASVDLRNIGAEKGIVLGGVTEGGAMGHIEPGVEISNCPEPAYFTWQGSILAANNTAVDNADYRAIEATHGSVISFRQGELTNCPDIGLYASHSSRINARDVTITGIGSQTVYAQSTSTIDLEGSVTIDDAERGLEITKGSVVSLDDAVISNVSFGAVVGRGGTFVVQNSEITGGDVFGYGGSNIVIDGTNVTGASDANVTAERGATVSIYGAANITGAGGDDLAVADGGVISLASNTTYGTANVPVNTIQSDGIIFDST